MEQVRGALTSVSEFREIELTNATKPPTGQFMAPVGYDVETRLNELDDKHDKLAGWKRVK